MVMKGWGRDAYAVDCPGHGARFQEIKHVTLADYPKAVVEFIDQHKLNNVVLVGNSTGGLICQLTAQEIPERIAHIIWYMAFILKDGQSILETNPPEFQVGVEKMRESNMYPVPPTFRDPRKVDAGYDGGGAAVGSEALAAATASFIDRQSRPETLL